LRFNHGTIKAPSLGKGRWLRLGEDGGVEAGRQPFPGSKFKVALGVMRIAQVEFAVAVGGR